MASINAFALICWSYDLHLSHNRRKIGHYSNFMSLTFNTYALKKTVKRLNWTILYWGFQILAGPLMEVLFIAKISKGRITHEFIL
jgi:choline-glycine betaine transporter